MDPELAFQINKERGLHGKPSVVPKIKSYDEEKDHLEGLSKGAEETVSKVVHSSSFLCPSDVQNLTCIHFLQFKFRMELYDRVLAGLASSEDDPENLVMNKNELIDVLNTMRGGDRALEEEAGAELGKWIGSFLVDNGYAPHTSSVL